MLFADALGQLDVWAAPVLASGALISVGCVTRLEELVATVEDATPDVVVLHLVGTPKVAIASIEAVMASAAPTPVLLVHGPAVSSADLVAAQEAGALEALLKPSHTPAEDDPFWKALAQRLVLLAQVPVVHRLGAKRARPTPSVRPSIAVPPSSVAELSSGRVERASAAPGPAAPHTRPAPEARPAQGVRRVTPLVAMVASLGGPQVLARILSELPADFPAAIVICQHMGLGFTAGLAQWLRSRTSLPVAEANDLDRLRPSTVYIAPAGKHLRVSHEGVLRLDDGPPVMGFKPSCNVLLESVAQCLGSHALGVILTGMGSDGAKGMQQLRAAGGRTLAQDEATCRVFGMPGEAIALGAIDEVLPVEHIAEGIRKWGASW